MVAHFKGLTCIKIVFILESRVKSTGNKNTIRIQATSFFAASKYNENHNLFAYTDRRSVMGRIKNSSGYNNFDNNSSLLT